MFIYYLRERLIINLINNYCNCEFGIVLQYRTQDIPLKFFSSFIVLSFHVVTKPKFLRKLDQFDQAARQHALTTLQTLIPTLLRGRFLKCQATPKLILSWRSSKLL